MYKANLVELIYEISMSDLLEMVLSQENDLPHLAARLSKYVNHFLIDYMLLYILDMCNFAMYVTSPGRFLRNDKGVLCRKSK